MIKLNIEERAGKFYVKTPYSREPYEFQTEAEAQHFIDYCTKDPDYNDPVVGDIVEWTFFVSLEHPDWVKEEYRA